MATTSIENQPTVAPIIRVLLGALRGRIRWYVWLEGLTCAVAWLGAAFWASLAIDWFFEPPRLVRGVMLAAVVLVLFGVLLRMIGRRAFVGLSDSNMATLLERRFAHLDDTLLTAVVLTGRKPDPAQCNPQMLTRTCREAAERVGDVRLAEVFNPMPLQRSTSAAVLLAASVLVFGLTCSPALGTWARRSLAFYDELWPRYTHLEVEGFPQDPATGYRLERVARGADLEVIAKASTKEDGKQMVLPEVVQVRYRIEGGRRDRKSMNRLGTADPDKDPFQGYSYTFQGILAPIRFDVVGGDDRVRDLRIEVVESPNIDEMVLDCEFPPYMGRTPRTLPVTGVMQIPSNTLVTVRARANKELVRVQLDTALGEGSLSQKVLESKDLSADRRSFRHTLDALSEDLTLLFTLSDTDGITSREPIRLALVTIADEPPQLAVQLNGIGPEITAKARLPAAGSITDDYGIDKVWFEYTIEQDEPATRPIDSPSGDSTELKLDAAMEVGDLDLTPGQKLLLSVKAADRYDFGEGPNVGTSERWMLDIVTPEQLRARLEQRELVLRQRFERIIEEVTETRDLLLRIDFGTPDTDEKTGSKSAGESTRDGAEPGDEPEDEQEVLSPKRRLAVRTMRVQRASQNSRKNAHETLGVADAFEDIRQQLINNRIDTEELNSRLQGRIVAPLLRIAEEMFPELDLRLERLEAKVADEKTGPRQCDLALQEVDAILLEMRRVLDQMLELESFNEAVELLRQIIKLQEELKQQTEKRHKQQIRDYLED